MKRVLLFIMVCALAIGLHAQTRVFTPRYTNASVRGNIRYVSNNIITSSGVTTTEAPPGGSATNNSNAGVNLDIDNVTSTIIPWNSTWKFSDSGYVPGTGTWKDVAYPDGGWVSATAGLPASAQRDIGYGDGDEVTPYIYAGCPGARPAVQIPGGCGTKYWTTYFRQQFNVTSVAAFTGFQLNLHRDDGAVIYVNGIEVARTNMPSGVIAYNTPALTAAEGANEDTTINIGTSAFVDGANTIAIEIHQSAQNSSDVSFRMEMLGLPYNYTFNSSSSDLSLASCSEVLWAGLYWGASLGGSAQSAWRGGRDTLWLKVPGAANYVKVTSTQTDLHDSSSVQNHTGYTAFADITSLINTVNANGTYTIGNMATPVSTGFGNQAAGWTIVIAYRNLTDIPRNLVVFDGFELVAINTQKDIKLSGFLTPLTGPVSCELGAVCYDGDRASSDGWFFKQDSAAAGIYTDLSNAGVNGPSDSWNSTISYLGSNVTTRNPAHLNTLGYDADIIQLPNGGNAVLGNNQTTARVRLSSPSGGENFFMQVVTSSISVAEPSFTVEKRSTDLNGGSLQPGDQLQYTIIYQNNGTDSSINTVITDSLPYNVGYLPGSMVIDGIAKTDAIGDDEADYDNITKKVVFRMGVGATGLVGGYVRPTRRDTVIFTVVVTNVCQLLACNNQISNQARVDYTGKNSGNVLVDNSGYFVSGCFVTGPITNTVVGGCTPRNDTSVVNLCPLLSVTLPSGLYTGYQFYSAQPFITANIFNPATPITTPGTYYAYTGNGSCGDTIRINVLLQLCPDLDDDNDGIPDLVESNGSDAFGDDDFDGIPNFTDSSFPGFTDSNSDGVNDNFDSDKDGIPNQMDIDSDNDGIPDVVEAGGVDANGDGRIDNYIDADVDGLSDNVDANLGGAAGSGNGLGLPDLDGDGVPNYIDLDSDNDGIPDVVEAGGLDANNDGHLDNYTDADADGYSDNIDGDANNDGTAENSANALLRTGNDTDNDGRANSYPYKNMDRDAVPNPYDLDSDSDGITDVREAGFADSNVDGLSDGTKGSDGWDDTIDALGALVLPNTDGSLGPNYLDIDSDNDGIPDNVEGIATFSYLLPSGADSDNDGIDNAYDGMVGFGGNGITPNDQDLDTVPDYMDSDSDGDGESDLREGNDINGNCITDEPLTPIGDTDGDGLDDRFDADNANSKGTSQYMGLNGSHTGDPSPGTFSTVQTCSGSPANERDWRLASFVLDADIVAFTGSWNQEKVKLNWVISCDYIIDHFDIERSDDARNFKKAGTVKGAGTICRSTAFSFEDAGVNSLDAYYRIRIFGTNGKTKQSATLPFHRKAGIGVKLLPNPAINFAELMVNADKAADGFVNIYDGTGRLITKQTVNILPGTNAIPLKGIDGLPHGVYTVELKAGQNIYHGKLVKR